VTPIIDVKLTLNNADTSGRVKDVVRDAVQRRKDATETAEEAFGRVGAMSLSDKEREMFIAARDAFRDGRIGNVRPDGGKWTKVDVLTAGAQVLRKHEESQREARIREVLATKPANYHILTDDSDLPAFIERLRTECRRQVTEWRDRFRVLGVDTMTAGDFEGTGIDSYIDLSIGFSVWLPLLNEGYYLPYGHVSGFDVPYPFKNGDPQLTRSKVISATQSYLTHPKHGKTFHMGSARYDLHIAINDGYEIRGCVWDTLDAMYDMNEHEESYGLKPLTAKYGDRFGVDGAAVYTFEDMFGNRSPAPFNTEIVGIYAIKDVYYGWKLFEWQFETMKSAPGRLLECYAEIDSKLPETDVFMARCGFEIDLDGLTALSDEFTPLLEKARADVVTAYGIDAEFIRKMDRVVSSNPIQKWIGAQKKRTATKRAQIEKKREKIAELEAQEKAHLKSYENEVAQLAKYETELAEIAEPTVDNAPQFITEFSITNGNHLAYLIYDYLSIDDKTPRIKRGKTRSTAADVLDLYYAEEEALKPLATVAAYEKLLNTYVTKIPEALEVDGRLHSEFKAGGTATGRYSSSGYSGRPIDILDEFETGEICDGGQDIGTNDREGARN
jgi:DNA polymerase-1